MDDDHKALLYFAYRARGGGRWAWRLWWRAVDLLPDPQDMPPHGPRTWAPVAESMAYSLETP